MHLSYVLLIMRGCIASSTNQQTAFNFVLVGATALGIGGDLIPREIGVRTRSQLVRIALERYREEIYPAPHETTNWFDQHKDQRPEIRLRRIAYQTPTLFCQSEVSARHQRIGRHRD
jgi:hypothetical protein